MYHDLKLGHSDLRIFQCMVWKVLTLAPESFDTPAVDIQDSKA
jgi:hypothetical protein